MVQCASQNQPGWGLGWATVRGRGSPLLLAELALGAQGSQDRGAGTQAVAPTPLLQLLDVGQDLPLLRGAASQNPSLPCPQPAPPTQVPTSVSLTFLLFSKLMRSPWGQSLSELEPPESRIEGQGQGLGCQESHCTKGPGVGSGGSGMEWGQGQGWDVRTGWGQESRVRGQTSSMSGRAVSSITRSVRKVPR